MSWWRPCANISKLCCRGEGGSILLESSLVDSSKNAIERPDASENDESEHLKTLKLFRNAHSLRVYHGVLGYIPEELKEKLVEEATLSIAKLDA